MPLRLASSKMLCNVGASTTYLQGACLGELVGGLYTHEGVLYHPVTYALVVDALQHMGPEALNRYFDLVRILLCRD